MKEIFIFMLNKRLAYSKYNKFFSTDNAINQSQKRTFTQSIRAVLRSLYP